MMVPADCAVIIAGLGPTGAVLANLLGQMGISVVAFDRDEDIYYAPKAVHFDDEIMRVFQQAGLADTIAASAESFTTMGLRLRPAGPDVLRMPVGNQDRRYGHAGAWWFHQPTLERQLHEGLAPFPHVHAVRGMEIVDLAQDAGGVTVTARNRAGETVSVRGAWLVGCDGGRSFVRRTAGIALDSADFDQPWVVVDTKARCGTKDPHLPDYHFQVCDPAQPVTFVPMAGPYYEWQFMVMDGKSEREATDPAFVRRQLQAFADLDRIEITRIAHYTFHALWAREWRKGRVILAGDAAHQMPPFLGQGMCSGVRDAQALAWRLAMVLQGTAREDILDDYAAERAGHVAHIIEGAMFLGNLIQTRSRVKAVLRNWLLFRLPRAVPPLRKLLMAQSNRKRPLRGGGFGGNCSALAGQLMIQPRVRRDDGGEVLLDNVLGDGFAVIARTGAPGKGLSVPGIALRLVEFGPVAGHGGVVDSDRALDRLFRTNGVDFVVVRPDRYIFDAGKAADLPRILADLAARLGARAATAMERAA